MFAVLLAAAVARPPVPAVVPVFQSVEVKNGRLTWLEHFTTTKPVAVTRTRTVERNGRQMQEAYQVTEQVPVTELRELVVPKDARLTTPAGRPLTHAQAAEALLRRGAAVRVDTAGVPVPAFLALLRDDTVVIHWTPPPPPGAGAKP